MPQSTYTSFDDLMTALGVTDPPQEWRAGWEEAQASFPGELAFTTDDFLDEVNGVCGYAEDILAALRAVMAVVRGDEGLSRLAWLWHVLAFHSAEEPNPYNWPRPAVMGAWAEMFPAVVLLSGLPRLFALHRERVLPVLVTRDTCRDLEIWMRHALRYTGAWGFTRLAWMMNHCAGRLYRLGRLQFVHRPFTGGVRAYRHRQHGQVLALSEPGICYRRDGLVNGTNGRLDEEAWTAMLEITAQTVHGYPMHPAGHALATPVTLSPAEWEPLFAPGDAGLEMHIPADGKMDIDACGDALQQALAFYPRYFPELPPARAFFCCSWLLDAQYEQLLPAESNIVRFLREFYCYPIPSDDSDPFFRVFGPNLTDRGTAPRDTTLRRAMLDFTAAGHGLHMAAGIISIAGLEWGSGQFRRMKMPD